MKLLFKIEFHVDHDELSRLVVVDVGIMKIGDNETIDQKIDRCRRKLKHRAKVYDVMCLGEVYGGVEIIQQEHLYAT